jgi:hypothetical protein
MPQGTEEAMAHRPQLEEGRSRCQRVTTITYVFPTRYLCNVLRIRTILMRSTFNHFTARIEDLTVLRFIHVKSSDQKQFSMSYTHQAGVPPQIRTESNPPHRAPKRRRRNPPPSMFTGRRFPGTPSKQLLANWTYSDIVRVFRPR